MDEWVYQQLNVDDNMRTGWHFKKNVARVVNFQPLTFPLPAAVFSGQDSPSRLVPCPAVTANTGRNCISDLTTASVFTESI